MSEIEAPSSSGQQTDYPKLTEQFPAEAGRFEGISGGSYLEEIIRWNPDW